MKNIKEIVVFDFETTGLSATNNEILEIGAMKLIRENGVFKVSDELSLLLKTEEVIPEKITEITNITIEMQEELGVSQEEAFQKFSSLISSESLLIAYNIQFDLSFLEAFYKKNWDKNYKITNNILDVMAVYKDRHKFPHKLDNAVSTYNVNVLNTHRALDDVKATYAALEAMQVEQDNISKYINKIGYNKKYGVSGIRLPHVKYIAQYGGYREIEKL